jgi:Asp-tRNA(Asn)/Glu-tRNA(Gln) amidotransferase A subunit family amidase
MAPADWNPRFVNGRTVKALDFLQSQRRRYMLISAWGEYMKDLDMFIASPSADVGANSQTGHPCAVVPYKFDVPPQFGGGRGGAAPPPVADLKPQPICATIIGNLYNDDKILSVAHQFQVNTDIHLKHPSL